MEKKITEYEAPRIDDHGDLAELTAAKTVGKTFDGNFMEGQPIPPNIQTLP